jgi:hypothetical protein
VNIAVLLDGTWSDANTHTNIAQIHARVPRRVGGVAQEVCYIEGVGTGPFDRLQGGILGAGLDDDIREAYSFIGAHHHTDDDRIHLIGYSRGAFAARSLAGMIAKCGIIRETELPAKAVFARYRDTNAPGLREMQEGEKAARTAEDKLLLARSGWCAFASSECSTRSEAWASPAASVACSIVTAASFMTHASVGWSTWLAMPLRSMSIASSSRQHCGRVCPSRFRSIRRGWNSVGSSGSTRTSAAAGRWLRPSTTPSRSSRANGSSIGRSRPASWPSRHRFP